MSDHLHVQGVEHHSCCFCGAVRECPACFPGPCDEPGGQHLWQLHHAEKRRTLLVAQPVEPREGLLTVYDHTGAYMGCIGAETWAEMLA